MIETMHVINNHNYIWIKVLIYAMHRIRIWQWQEYVQYRVLRQVLLECHYMNIFLRLLNDGQVDRKCNSSPMAPVAQKRHNLSGRGILCQAQTILR